MDLNDKLSIGILFLGLVAVGLIVNYLPNADTHVLNVVTVIGSVSSTAAAIIAIIQILKIKSSNESFIHSMEVMGNNLIIDNISRSIDQIRLIKENFEMGKAQESRSNFSFLKSEIIKISFFKSTSKYESKLSEYISICNKVETQIYEGTLGTSKEDLSEVFLKLSELESLLQEIHVKVTLAVNKI